MRKMGRCAFVSTLYLKFIYNENVLKFSDSDNIKTILLLNIHMSLPNTKNLLPYEKIVIVL